MSNLAKLNGNQVNRFRDDLSEHPDRPLTLQQLRRVIPKSRRHTVTPKLLGIVNRITSEPEVRDAYRQNLIGFTDILKDPAMPVARYVQAVKYISYKMLGYSNFDSWVKTFPERYQRMLDDQKSNTFMRTVVAQYNRGKLVNLILEQTLVPVWVLNHDLYQKAVNVQAELMLTAKSEKVRSDAAAALLTHLRQPEATKLSLDLHVKEDDSVRELREATLDLVRQQKLMIGSGAMDARQVAESKVITDTEFERVD